jgi:chaperonin GroEL
MKDLLPILEALMNAGKKDLIILADDIEWEALTTIVLNKLKWVLNILAIKNPGFWDSKKEILRDLAVLTWATIITSDLAMKLENATIEDLWSAKTVVSGTAKTTIIWGGWDSEAIQSRVEEIKKAISYADGGFARDKLAERLAKLDWGVAVVKVWAASEVEAKEKKLRIEDALNATRAAVEEWVVAGWGTALLKASTSLDWVDFGNADQNLGAEIVAKAIKYPNKQIVENAGKEPGVIENKILENNDVNYWYDASNDSFVDMIEAWIIDPKKVARVALEQAVSLAGMFLTTEAAVSEIPKPESDAPQMPMGGMWGMWGMM